MKRLKRVSQIDNAVAASAPITSHDHHPNLHSNRKKRGGLQVVDSSISDEELAHHVSSLYIHGPGGVFSEVTKKRERRELRKYHMDTTTASSGSIYRKSALEEEYEKYLRKLDRHPALVLNADYQVSQEFAGGKMNITK